MKDRAEELANERIVSILVPSTSKNKSQRNPFEMIFGGNNASSEDTKEEPEDGSLSERRRGVKFKLLAGQLEDDIIEIDVEDTAPTMLDMFAGQGNDQMGMNMQEMFGSLLPKRTKNASCRSRKHAKC